MMKITLILFVFLLFTTVSLAQPPVKAGAVPVKSADEPAKTYEDLLAKLKAGDTGIDYKALRMAYTATKDYSSYGIDGDMKTKLFKALGEKKYKDAVDIAEEVLKTNYVEMNAHFVAFVSHRELGDAKKSEYHKAVFSGLINSILNGVDGKTAKTAYVVICVPEEYVVLNYLGHRRGDQALVNEDGHKFDVLTVTSEKNETLKLYFNIDIVWKGYEKMFSK
jgi:hypothetical protein